VFLRQESRRNFGGLVGFLPLAAESVFDILTVVPKIALLSRGNTKKTEL
jgi:hypothetical protein